MSLAEIGRRIGKTRESIRLLAAGNVTLLTNYKAAYDYGHEALFMASGIRRQAEAVRDTAAALKG